MTLLNTPYGLYIYWSLIAGVFAAITIYFKQQEKITIIQPSDQVNFMPMKNTSSVAMMMDPRTDADR
jgi:allophanate hydrolase subunit 1